MKIKRIYEVGDFVKFSCFAFDNKSGGTGLSDSSFNESFKGVGVGIVIKEWEDYETGQILHCRATSPDLLDYMRRNAKNTTVFVSEFDIID